MDAAEGSKLQIPKPKSEVNASGSKSQIPGTKIQIKG
jgi:hypothetical protein